MSYVQLRNVDLRVCSIVFLLVFANTNLAAAQATATSKKTQSSENPINLPQQPADDATTELKDPVTPQDPKKVEARAAFMEGLAAQKDGNLSDAIEAFERAAVADPTAPEPIRAHAILLRRLGRSKQAEAMARKAVELDPDDYEMRLELAGMLLAQNKATEAAAREASALVDAALTSKRLDTKSADYVNLQSVRGKISLLMQDEAKAAESYAVILDALQTPEDFGLDFRQHQALMKDRATGYETIGQIMLKVGRYDNAITAFKALTILNEDAPSEDHYWLALVHYRKDELTKAEENLTRYFESSRRSRRSLQLLNDIYNAKSEPDQIMPRLTELAEGSNDADSVNLFLGDVLLEKGKGDEAAKVFRDVIANSGTADAHLGLVRVDILNQDAESLFCLLYTSPSPRD